MNVSFNDIDELDAEVERTINDARLAIGRRAEALTSEYYSEVDRLQKSGAVPGYVALRLRYRMIGNSISLEWFERHARGGRRGFRSIKRGRSSDYNINVLLARAVPDMSALITKIETRARMLRSAAKMLVEASRSLRVLNSRVLEFDEGSRS